MDQMNCNGFPTETGNDLEVIHEQCSERPLVNRGRLGESATAEVSQDHQVGYAMKRMRWWVPTVELR
jgi:hypothetical protein